MEFQQRGSATDTPMRLNARTKTPRQADAWYPESGSGYSERELSCQRPTGRANTSALMGKSNVSTSTTQRITSLRAYSFELNTDFVKMLRHKRGFLRLSRLRIVLQRLKHTPFDHPSRDIEGELHSEISGTGSFGPNIEIGFTDLCRNFAAAPWSISFAHRPEKVF